ncbi:50S ribosomal protein L25 [Buchnera aphidicola]|uniref:50S ribosomal protein L25 n=1 Tax=Buchnera aphidicola TaxID=9 RepID=UPI0031B87607
MLIIKALNRIKKGTRSSRRLRKFNKLPAILYGKNFDSLSIELDYNDLLNIYNKIDIFKNKIKIFLDDKFFLVKVKNIQYHSFKKKILHIDFFLL